MRLKFLHISEAKLKIIMTAEELSKYGLNDTAENGSASRRAVWRVLEAAKKDVGFDPAGDKILVQFYPMSDGGCELFITKLGILSPASAKLVAKSDRITLLSKHKSAYFFSDRESLTRATAELSAITNGKLICSIFTDNKGGFVLSLDEYVKGMEQGEFLFLTEFSRRISAELLDYVAEHYTCLYESRPIGEFDLEKSKKDEDV